MKETESLTRHQCLQSLVEAGKLSEDKLQEMTAAAHELKTSVFHVLIDKEVLSEPDLLDFIAQYTDLPILKLPSLRLTRDIVQLIPKKIVERHQIVPVGRVGNTMAVAVSDPFEYMIADDIKEVANCTVVYVLCSHKAIQAAIENYYGEAATLDELLDGITEDNLEVIKEDAEDAGGGKSGAVTKSDDAPIVKMVKLIIEEAVRQRASDIHFEPYEKDFRVRYRIDGALRQNFAHEMNVYGALIARIKIMAQLDITEKRIPQDGRFRVRLSSKEIDFRVSVLPIYHGEKVVLRILDKGGVKSGLNNLGFSEKPTAVFAEAVKNPYGMILVTGPTGSGKSTTLYTILNTLNTPDRNIMTIEDPVEYQVEGITQTQVHTEVGMTFASGLRALLRQSPDIILIGEIRDQETADIGVKAALTGHLVFSTLHTNSAAGAMTRLVDMGVEPFLIANSVICVAAQRLIKKICEFCREPQVISPEILRRLGLKDQDVHGISGFKGKGCAKCNGTGYYGRMGVIEVLKVDTTIRNLVIQRKSSDVIARHAIASGMETLFENAFGIYKKGMTSIEEVLRVSTHD
jgi:type IV pilus assembly protein PilB